MNVDVVEALIAWLDLKVEAKKAKDEFVLCDEGTPNKQYALVAVRQADARLDGAEYMLRVLGLDQQPAFVTARQALTDK